MTANTTLTSNVNVLFSYAAPVLSTINPSSLTTGLGSRSLVLTGSSFGTSATVTIGGVNCPVATQSHSSITCTVADGVGQSLSVVVTVGARSTSALLFSYLPPTISLIAPVNGPTAGGLTIALNGSSFATAALGAASVLFGTTPCNVLSQTHNYITCTLPAGQGSGVLVTATVAGRVSNSVSFSYDGSVPRSQSRASLVRSSGWLMSVSCVVSM